MLVSIETPTHKVSVRVVYRTRNGRAYKAIARGLQSTTSESCFRSGDFGWVLGYRVLGSDPNDENVKAGPLPGFYLKRTRWTAVYFVRFVELLDNCTPCRSVILQAVVESTPVVRTAVVPVHSRVGVRNEYTRNNSQWIHPTLGTVIPAHTTLSDARDCPTNNIQRPTSHGFVCIRGQR